MSENNAVDQSSIPASPDETQVKTTDKTIRRHHEGDSSGIENAPSNLSMLFGVHLDLTVELGRTHLTVKQVLDLQKGSVVELDRIAGEPVDIYVNDRIIAKGDVVVVDDKFGVRITEIIAQTIEGVV